MGKWISPLHDPESLINLVNSLVSTPVMQAFLLLSNQVSKLTSDLKLEDGVKTLLIMHAEAKIFELSLSDC